MYLLLKLAIKPNVLIEKLLYEYGLVFREEVLRVYRIFLKQNCTFEYAYKYISNNISYNSKHLVLAEAKMKFNLRDKFVFSYSSYWSNSSYMIKGNDLILELGLYKHRELIQVPIFYDHHKMNLLKETKLMNMKIKKRNHCWFAYAMVEMAPKPSKGTNEMGVDIGIKVPAVAALSNGKVRFFGNGRYLRYRQRQLRSHIQVMQSDKRFQQLTVFNHKLNHVLVDIDHKISKQIIDFAVAENVGIIKLERLTRINRHFHVSSYKDIYLWSYRRLQECISYKAEMKGISIRYINPYNTSKKCPKCGSINIPIDRLYQCKNCDYHAHRDVVAAINILHVF